jgi:hypothetical protein
MKYLFFFFTIFLFSSINAQEGAEIGLLGGVSLYSGDLSQEEFGVYTDELNPAFGFFGRFNLNKTVALRLGLSLGRLSGDDANTGRTRDLSFRTRLTECSLVGEVNLFKFGRYRNQGVVPYLFGGVAVFNFNPETSFDGDFVALQPLGTEGQGLPNYEAPYKLTQLSIPMGVGIKFLLNDNITLGLEFGGRKTFTDHLDDISSVEVNYFDVLEGNGALAASLSNPNLAADPDSDSATYRRGGKYDDWYYIGAVMVSFRLNGSGQNPFNSGKGIGCPTF